jgi:hypothetical protein
LTITFLKGLFYTLASVLGAYFIFKELNHKILFARATFFDKESKGRILNRISTDVDIIVIKIFLNFFDLNLK